MDNEATLEKLGDSEMSATAEETTAVEHKDAEAAVECTNGVCVLNWKPTKAA